MHNGLLTINGEKMAKSLNNYVTVKDVLKEYPQSAAADILKIFFLQARYSMPIDFSHKKMEEAKTATFHLLNTLKKGDFDIKDFTNLDPIEKKIIDDAKAKFESEMDDDFNMPQALATIHSIERHCNTRLDEYNDGESPAVQCEIQYSINTIRELAGALGLSLNERDFNAKDPL
jgi:cysteinyl-tRNA synthetase